MGAARMVKRAQTRGRHMHKVRVPPARMLTNPENDQPLMRLLEDHEKERATVQRRDGAGNLAYYAPDEAWTMYRFLARFIFPDPWLGGDDKEKDRPIKAAKHQRRLKIAFKNAACPLDTAEDQWPEVAIDSDTRDAVLRVVESSDQAKHWNMLMFAQLDDFVEAFRDAKEVKADNK